MTIRKILVPLDGSEATRAALATAFDLAAQFEAHVDALHVRIDPTDAVAFVGEGMSGEIVEDLINVTERQSAARAAMARAAFDETCRAAAIPTRPRPEAGVVAARYLEREGREESVIARFGRTADLIVAPHQGARLEPALASTLDAALMGAGRPVFVAGARPSSDAAGFPRIIVAWNASPESARAVAAALPFLTRAQDVRIAATDAEAEDPAPTEALAEYLSCHGVDSRPLTLEREKPIGEALARAAADADLVVMGAYTHSRLWQLIIGGVTRHMLHASAAPLLMTH